MPNIKLQNINEEEALDETPKVNVENIAQEDGVSEKTIDNIADQKIEKKIAQNLEAEFEDELDEDWGKWYAFKKNVLESETVKIVSIIVFAIGLVLYIAPFFLNNAALKLQIEQKISQISGASIAINGKVSVAFLPTPTITLNQVVLRNYKTGAGQSERIHNLYARSVALKLTIFKFIEDPVIRKIILVNPILESYTSQSKNMTRDNAFRTSIVKFEKRSAARDRKITSSISAMIFSVAGSDASEFTLKHAPNLDISNGHMISYDAFQRKKEVTNINAELAMNQKKIAARGDFNSSNIISNFNLLAKFNSDASKSDSLLQVISSVVDFKIEGNFTAQNQGGIFNSDFNGVAQMQIFDIQKFYQSYIDHNGVIASKLRNTNKPIKLSANIRNKTQEVSISDIVINSDIVTGSGVIDMNLSKKVPIVDIGLDLKNLDLDEIWSSDPVEFTAPVAMPIQDEVAPLKSDGSVSTLIVADDVSKMDEKISLVGKALINDIKNIDLAAEIKIKDVTYLNGDIKDVDLYLTVPKAGEMLILPLIFKIPGDGVARLNGVIDNSLGSPKFIGKFDALGSNLKEAVTWLGIKSQNLKFDNIREYGIYSDVMLLPNKTNLSNFYMSLNKGDSEFLGTIKINSSSRTPVVVSDFRINNFNIDDYFLTSEQNAYLSPGSLLRKMLWLNDITSNNRLKFKFNKLLYRGEEFPSQSLELRFRQGYLEVRDLNLLSETTDLNANLLIDISDKNPTFNLEIDSNKFYYESSSINTYVDGPNIVASEGTFVDDDFDFASRTKKRSPLDRFFGLPSLEGFNGKVKIGFKNLKINDIEAQDTIINGSLNDGRIADVEVFSDIFSGHFEYKGLLSLRGNKTLNGNLSYNNANLKPLMSNLMDIESIDGLANIAASVTVTADNLERFKENLEAVVKFNAANVSLQGYGINDLMIKMFSPRKNAVMLQNPELILSNSETQSVFEKVTGSVIFKDKKDGVIKANLSTQGINGILSGSLNLASNQIDALFNVIFLTGKRQNPQSINIATNLKGKLNAVAQVTNLDQARKYLGLPKIERGFESGPQKKDVSDVEQETKNQQKKYSNEPLREIEIPKNEQRMQ